MKRIWKVLLLVSLFIANILLYSPEPTHIPKELSFYVNTVYEISNHNLDGRRLHYKFVDNQSMIIGTCYMLKGVISLDRETWNSFNERQRVILLAHEITHCVKYTDHEEDGYLKGCLDHYMQKYIMNRSCATKMYNYYVNQMKDV